MKEKAIVLTCDKCGAIDILRKVADGPSDITDIEGYQTRSIGWETVVRYPSISTDTRQLCPECSKKYFDLIDRFWNENKEDEDD